MTRTHTHIHTQNPESSHGWQADPAVGAFILKTSHLLCFHWQTHGGPAACWLLCEVLTRVKEEQCQAGASRDQQTILEGRVKVAFCAHLLPFLSCSGLQEPDLLPTHHMAPWPSGFQLGSANGISSKFLDEEGHAGRRVVLSPPGSSPLIADRGPSHTVSLASAPKSHPLHHLFRLSEEHGVLHQVVWSPDSSPTPLK